MEDLYDEFGNFIGDAEESEEEEVLDTTADAYLQDDEDEPEAEVNNQQLMQIDGGWNRPNLMGLTLTPLRRWTFKCSHITRGQAVLSFGAAGVW